MKNWWPKSIGEGVGSSSQGHPIISSSLLNIQGIHYQMSHHAPSAASSAALPLIAIQKSRRHLLPFAAIHRGSRLPLAVWASPRLLRSPLPPTAIRTFPVNGMRLLFYFVTSPGNANLYVAKKKAGIILLSPNFQRFDSFCFLHSFLS